MTEKSFQDLLGPANHCHGCGPANDKGLRIKSYWQGDDAICKFKPQPHHCAGAADIVNGGIIASLIDCHSVCTAMADAYRRAGREIGTSPQLWYVTGNLTVSYVKPTPLDAELVVKARVVEVNDRKTKLSAELSARGEICARGEVLAIQVKRV